MQSLYADNNKETHNQPYKQIQYAQKIKPSDD